MPATRVFLAAPYSQYMDTATGEVAATRRSQLDGLRHRFLDAGAEVFSAHHNESWGRGWLPPDKCTPADFRAMRAADVVCAVVGSPPSSGVAVELGWASAFGKPIVVVDHQHSGCSPLILGIDSITSAYHLLVPEWWDEEHLASIVELTLSLAADPDAGIGAVALAAQEDPAHLGYVGAGVVG